GKADGAGGHALFLHQEGEKRIAQALRDAEHRNAGGNPGKRRQRHPGCRPAARRAHRRSLSMAAAVATARTEQIRPSVSGRPEAPSRPMTLPPSGGIAIPPTPHTIAKAALPAIMVLPVKRSPSSTI